MTSFIYASGEYGEQELISGEIGVLGKNASIINMGGFGIVSFQSDVDVRIYGQVLAKSGVTLIGDNSHLVIGTTGVIDLAMTGTNTYVAAYFEGVATTATFLNAGWISGDAAGAIFDTLLGGKMLATNSGTIHGETAAIFLKGQGSDKISNSGTILGDIDGITNIRDGVSYNPALTLINSGLIQGNQFSVHCGNAIDTITNRGTLDGNVFMGDGADSFDNRGGTVYGSIDLGLGNDNYIAGLSEEIVSGGLGSDTLNFTSSQTGVTVALDFSIANTGTAAGDDYTGFEILRGSNFGGDRFIGTAANETFWGNGGADTLSGAAGVDKLIGGAGIDQLSGGAGNDNFIFNATTEGGDLISDFGNAGTNIDHIKIKASGFGGGLVVGALSAAQFIVRADHAAQDSNDRFIFNTADHSLWFDVDGNGAAAAVMVADLQNTSAIMTAADILLI
jgi:Ca2+-binding RTX toxin-like protein